MKLRVVIFDIYGTLLKILPPPANRDQLWAQLWQQYGRPTPSLSLAALESRCQLGIQASHAQSRRHGIAYPEVDWRAVIQEAVPELKSWPGPARDDFIYKHAQLFISVQLMEGATDILRHLVKRRRSLGLCSNCQAYTVRELSEALRPADLTLDIFDRAFCFWSYQAGFSKPDPEVFRQLHQRAVQRGIAADEILMVGDRLDNDIAPAAAIGWQTWLVTSNYSADHHSGDLIQLKNWLSEI